MHRGKRLNSATLPLQNKLDPFPFAHGTRMLVKDLFGNVPVRLKYHDRLLDNKNAFDQKWNKVVLSVCGLIVAWPRDVTVKMISLGTPGTTLEIFSGNVSTESNDVILTCSSSSYQKTRHQVSRFPHLLYSAKLITEQIIESFCPFTIATDDVEIYATISKIPNPCRKLQFMSLGIHPLIDSLYEHQHYYDIINDVFTHSFFGTEYHHSQHNCMNDLKYQNRVGKGVHRWPVFMISIHLKDNNSHWWRGACLHSDQTIKNALTELAIKWLKRNYFLSATLKLPSPDKSSNLVEIMNSTTASKMKPTTSHAIPTPYKAFQTSNRIKCSKDVTKSQLFYPYQHGNTNRNVNNRFTNIISAETIG